MSFPIAIIVVGEESVRTYINWERVGALSVGQWLSQGPNMGKVHMEGHPLWQPYTAKIKDTLLNPQENHCLYYTIEEILDVREHGLGAYVSGPSSSRGRRCRGPSHGHHRLTPRPQVSIERNEASTPSHRSSRARLTLQWLSNALFLPAAVLIYSVNISSALAYLMLVNAPKNQQSLPSDVYWKA